MNPPAARPTVEGRASLGAALKRGVILAAIVVVVKRERRERERALKKPKGESVKHETIG